MYYPNMKLHNKFQERFEKIMGTILSGETIEGIKNVLNKNNTHIIKLILFYEHRENMFFKVLGFVIYGIMGKYVCLKYLFIGDLKTSSSLLRRSSDLCRRLELHKLVSYFRSEGFEILYHE